MAIGKLSLRKIKITDERYFSKWWRDKELLALTSGILEPLADKDVKRYFLAMLQSGNDYHFIILLDGNVIGHISLAKRKNGWYETQIIIGEKKYWGRGYDKKAIKYAVKIIDAWLPSKIQYDRIPALSVGLVHNGKIVYKRGFGFADVESLEPATPNTCYRIASISKTFTAVAIMQLAEQGKLHLDDKIHKYLPWFKSRSKDSDSNNITIRQILSHTAGVFRDGNTPHWADDKFPDITGLQKSISKAVVFENLTRFKYSNFGFALLGEVVKKISGVSYNEYVSENIIKKLGMERTAPDLTKENEGWLAKGYSRSIPNKEREAFHHIPTNAYASATGFLSNVSDLAKYLSALSLKNK